MASTSSRRWQFWIDRGGTFTDVVARRPDGTLTTHKLLSENPGRYPDPAVAAIRHLLQVTDDEPIPVDQIEAVRLGTTVATNLILEGKGPPTALLTTTGFKYVLEIGRQDIPRRSSLFAWVKPKRPVPPQWIFEVGGRIDALPR